MRNINYLFVAAIMSLATAPEMNAEKLVIMHTNDTHSQIDPIAEDGLGGVARRKVLIDSVRAEHPGRSLLVDAGDIVQGTLFFNIYKGEVEEKMMNALGYDIRILGNHEFDNGMEALAKNLETSDAELLCANYQMVGTPLQGLFIPYTIREFDGKRIAFIPVNLNPKGMIADRNVEGLGYVDAIEAANNLAWYAKNIEQADMVIAVTHIGYDMPNEPDDVELAKASKDIDVIIGGHSHTTIDPDNKYSEPFLVKNADDRDVLVAQTGKSGRYLGEITIDLDSLSSTPEYRLLRVDSRLDNRVDPAIESILSPYRDEVDRMNRKVVTKTHRFLEKDGDELLNFVSDFVDMRGRQLADNVDFAILNKGGLRHNLPKGNVTEGEIITLVPFFNKIQVIEVPGDSIAAVFDVMARTDGNGVSHQVEATYIPGLDRCTSITINGKELDPNRIYRIATIDYLANGGDYMSPLTGHKLVAESPQYLYEDFLEYFINGDGKGKAISGSDKKRMAPQKMED